MDRKKVKNSTKNIKIKDVSKQSLGGFFSHKGIVYQLDVAVNFCIRSVCVSLDEIVSVQYQNFTRVDDVWIKYKDRDEYYQCKGGLGDMHTAQKQFTCVKEIVQDFFLQYISDVNKGKINNKYIIYTEDNPKIFKQVLEKINFDSGEGNSYIDLLSKKELDFLDKIKSYIVDLVSVYNQEVISKFGKEKNIGDTEDIQKQIIFDDDVFLEFLKNIKINVVSQKEIMHRSKTLIDAYIKTEKNDKIIINKSEIIYAKILEYILQNPCKLITKDVIENIFNLCKDQ